MDVARIRPLRWQPLPSRFARHLPQLRWGRTSSRGEGKSSLAEGGGGGPKGRRGPPAQRADAPTSEKERLAGPRAPYELYHSRSTQQARWAPDDEDHGPRQSQLPDRNVRSTECVAVRTLQLTARNQGKGCTPFQQVNSAVGRPGPKRHARQEGLFPAASGRTAAKCYIRASDRTAISRPAPGRGRPSNAG